MPASAAAPAPASAQPPQQGVAGALPQAPSAPPPINPELANALRQTMGEPGQMVATPPPGQPQPQPFQTPPATPVGQPQPQPVSAVAHPTQPLPSDPGAALAALLGQPAQPAQPGQPAALPDLPGDNTPFNFLDMAPAGEDPMASLTKMVEDLVARTNASEGDAKFQQLMSDKKAEIQQRYGNVNPQIMEEFSDLIDTVRANVGSEVETAVTSETLRLQQTVDALKAQVEAMGQQLAAPTQGSGRPATPAQPQQDQSIEVYRHTLAEVIPQYARITSSPQFAQLLAMPVDPYNPDYTYNAKLGRMFKDRKTSDIVQFFSDFGTKYLASEQPAAVVPNNTYTASPNSVTPSLTPDKVNALFRQILKGELHASPQEVSALQMAVAKLNK